MVTKQPNILLFVHFHSKILSIVFVNALSIEIEVQFENFKYTTHANTRWHCYSVLFIGAQTTLQTGYSNVLLTDARANEVLTYEPFPPVRLRNTT